MLVTLGDWELGDLSAVIVRGPTHDVNGVGDLPCHSGEESTTWSLCGSRGAIYPCTGASTRTSGECRLSIPQKNIAAFLTLSLL